MGSSDTSVPWQDTQGTHMGNDDAMSGIPL